MNTTYISATDLKRKTAEILNMIYYEKKIAVVERFGKTLVKMIPCENKKGKKEEISLVLDRYFGSLPDFPRVNKERKFRNKSLTL